MSAADNSDFVSGVELYSTLSDQMAEWTFVSIPPRECLETCVCLWYMMVRYCSICACVFVMNMINVFRLAMCRAAGDPHYLTFDKVYYSYQGVCKYKLAGVIGGSTLPTGFSEFQIYARNEHRSRFSRAVSLVKYVELVIVGSTVRISRSLALVASGSAIPAMLTVGSRDSFECFC